MKQKRRKRQRPPADETEMTPLCKLSPQNKKDRITGLYLWQMSGYPASMHSLYPGNQTSALYQMSYQLFAFTRQQVDDRYLNHRITTWLLLH